MAIQSRNLRLQAQPVYLPPINHPELYYPEPGIHLRWQPDIDSSFPRYGYHLYRRPHKFAKSTHLNELLDLISDLRSEYNLGTSFGLISSDTELRLINNYFSLEDNEHFHYYVPPKEIAVEVVIVLYVTNNTSIEFKVANDEGVFEIRTLRAIQGETLEVRFKADDIRHVTISNAPVNLLDIETTLVFFHRLLTNEHNKNINWEKITATISLPLYHSEYLCENKPASFIQAQKMAEERIKYGPPSNWLENFIQIHSTLSLLAHGEYPQRMTAIIANSTEAAESNSPEAIDFNPLQTILMTSLHPAMAQLLGIYHHDTKPDTDIKYDYLLIADHNNQLSTASIEELCGDSDTIKGEQIDVSFAFDIGLTNEKYLTTPDELNVYALPPFIKEDYQSPLSAGLYWQEEAFSEHYSKNALYHVWYRKIESASNRHQDYSLLTRQLPVVFTKPESPQFEQQASATTDFNQHLPEVSLRYIHHHRSQGWHSYRVSAMDLFGRHSELSTSSRWMQRTPPPDPAPWYYQSDNFDSNSNNLAVSHEPVQLSSLARYAVGLLDDTPPPAPINLSAQYLDPDDPYLERDRFYNNWLLLQSIVKAHGVRVQWSWPYQYLNLITETQNFRTEQNSPLNFKLHIKPGEINALSGEILESIPEDLGETRLLIGFNVDIREGLYRGARLRADNQSYKVIEGSPLSNTQYDNEFNVLELWVKNAGHNHTIVPETLTLCTLSFTQFSQGSISVSNGQTEISGKNTLWTDEQLGWILFFENTSYTIIQVDSALQTIVLDSPFSGVSKVSSHYYIRHPFYIDYKQANAWPENFLVNLENGNAIDVYQEEPFSIKHWEVNDNSGNRIEGSGLTINQDIIILADISKLSELCGVDNYLWIKEDQRRDDKLYRIIAINNNQILLDARPESIPQSAWKIVKPYRHYQMIISLTTDSLPVSYNNPVNYMHIGVSAHINRQLNGIARIVDLNSITAGPEKVIRVNRTLEITPEVPIFTEPRLYSTPGDFYSTSHFKLPYADIPRSLSLQVFRCMDQGLLAINPATISAMEKNQLEEYIPTDWDEPEVHLKALAQVHQFITETDATRRKYLLDKELRDDSLQLLAGLPSYASCFSKLSSKPLTKNTKNNYYTDMLDGNTNARYFYRFNYVDHAHNSGPLSTSTPPIYIPNLLRPAAIRWHKSLADSNTIKLSWLSPIQPKTHYYHLFRTQLSVTENTTDSVANTGHELITLPGTRFVSTDIQGNIFIDLGELIEIDQDNELQAGIEAIYKSSEFTPQHLLSTPQNLNIDGHKINNIDWPVGTEVVIVYRDSNQQQCHTPVPNKPVTWLDKTATAGITYNYQIISSRIEATQYAPLFIYSLPSIWQSGKALSTAPLPPPWSEIYWSSIASDGTSSRVDDESPPDTNIAISLAWYWPADIVKLRIQRRAQNEEYWNNASPWLLIDSESLEVLNEETDTLNALHVRWFDTSIMAEDGYFYKIQCVNQQGLFNTVFNEEIINPLFNTENEN